MATIPNKDRVPSNAPRNLKFNAEKMDEVVNSKELTYTDRLETERKTWAGIESDFTVSQTDKEQRFQQFLINSGYVFLGEYENGPFQFTARNQYIRFDNQYYRLNASTSVGFTTTGITAESFENDVAHFVLMDGDTLRQNLAGIEGGSLVGLKPGGTVQDAIKYVTPWMFKSLVSNGDWSAALVAADNYAKVNNMILNGMGASFNVGKAISLYCGYYSDIKLYPLSGYAGSAPDFYVNANSGGAFLSGITCSSFLARGARILKGDFTGGAYASLANCSFTNNGSILRTTTLANVDTSKDFVIRVSSPTGFSVGDYVWIGDSKMMISSISSDSITLVNDGTKPITYSGGTGTGTYGSGQFFTRDGDGKNGLTIGNGTASMSVYTDGRNIFNGNGWFGLYNYANTDPDNLSVFHVDNCIASDNGFIGIGVGRVYAGSVKSNVCDRNGNNGIDINRGYAGLSITGNACRSNGVDGIFVGCYNTAPSAKDNICEYNYRTGILYSGSGTTSAADISGNQVNGNPKFNICLTGVSYSSISANVFNGSTTEHLRIEGRDGRVNPSATITDNIMLSSASIADVFGNFGGYSGGGVNGTAVMKNNSYATSKPVVKLINLNLIISSFSPEFYLTATRSSESVSAGSNLSFTLTAYKPYDTSVVDITASIASLQLSNTNSGLAVAPPSSLSRNAGIEITAQVASGKIIAAFNYGVITYGLIYSTAGTRYLHFQSGNNRSYIELIWS